MVLLYTVGTGHGGDKTSYRPTYPPKMSTVLKLKNPTLETGWGWRGETIESML